MNILQLIDGLTILAKYEPGGNVEPGHDVICGPGPENPKPEDKTRLDELGWHWDEEYDCWTAFT